MTDEKGGKGEGHGPFELGRSYDDVEPGLGRLHEAWHVKTGRPALRFFLTDRVEWQPSARWEALVVCEPSPPGVTILVNQAPADVPTTELVDVLVMTTAAVRRVEDNPRFRAHLASGLRAPEARPSDSGRQGRGSGRRAAAGLALLLGAVLAGRHVTSVWTDSPEGAIEAAAPSGVYLGVSETPVVLGYAIPQKPFRNQVLAPCPRRKSVVEISGGCWVTLEHKPPCDEDQGEHQGKCYLPVLKAPPVPQAAEP